MRHPCPGDQRSFYTYGAAGRRAWTFERRSEAMKKGTLYLESGEMFSGEWLGGQPRAGEVVFNTSHSGYEEIATDPSYFSQIMVMTAPQQGNYGVSDEVWESRRLWIEGFICVEVQNSSRDASWRRSEERRVGIVCACAVG